MAPTLPEGVLFSADFGADGFPAYPHLYPTGVVEGRDYGVAADPAGSGRRVGFFDSNRGLTHGNGSPRAGAEGPQIIRPAGAGGPEGYAFGLSCYVPEGAAPNNASQWLSLATPAYGPPFGGASPLAMVLEGVSSTTMRPLLGGSASMLGWEFTVPKGTWIKVLMEFRFAYDGWVRLWMADGLEESEWRAVPLRGTTDRLPHPTMKKRVNDSIAKNRSAQANSSRVGAYGCRTRVYVGHHVLGTDAQAVRSVMR